jgi:transcriptional regulator with XRE-family HTH domain
MGALVVQTTLSERLKQVREVAGLSQRELAERITAGGVSVSSQTVMRYEQGERVPPADYVAALSRVLSVDAAWVVLGTGSDAHRRLEARRTILDAPVVTSPDEGTVLDAVEAVRRTERGPERRAKWRG